MVAIMNNKLEAGHNWKILFRGPCKEAILPIASSNDGFRQISAQENPKLSRGINQHHHLGSHQKGIFMGHQLLGLEWWKLPIHFGQATGHAKRNRGWSSPPAKPWAGMRSPGYPPMDRTNLKRIESWRKELADKVLPKRVGRNLESFHFGNWTG